MPARIVVLPDVHRDLDKARAALLLCNVVDDAGRWICFDTVVVQLGDQIDGAPRTHARQRGQPHEHSRATKLDLACLAFFDDLDAQARLRNSRCISLAGNHEVMNAFGLFHYADLDGCTQCTRERAAVFGAQGALACHLADTRACALKIGPFVFSHAGITPEHLRRANGDLAQLNRLLDHALRHGDAAAAEALIGVEGSVLAHRTYAPDAVGPQAVAGANDVLRALGAHHLVLGHNVTPGRALALGPRAEIIVFDPGMSASLFDAPPAALDIRDNVVTPRGLV